MTTTKAIRFDMLTVGDVFKTRHDGWWCKKIGTARAMAPVAEDVTERTPMEFNVSPSTVVDARVQVEACGSGWTNDRCTKPLGHRGIHSNE
jgi:hypothetical protein